MKRIKLRITGIFFIALGLSFILTSSFILTGGAVLGNPQNGTQSFFGVLFLIAGLLFFILSREPRNTLEQLAKTNSFRELEEAYKGGGMGTSKDLRRMLERTGLETKKGGNHLKVYFNGKLVMGKKHPITIPHGKITKPVYRSILKELIEYKKK